MGIESTSGLGVKNVYGPRSTAEGRSGDIRTAGVVKELELDFRGGTYSFVSGTLPAGARVLEAIASVEEAFVLGGTSPTIDVGVAGSEGTDLAIEIPEASAENAGSVVFDNSPAGALGSVLSSATEISVALGGTSPTVTEAGRAKVVIRYIIGSKA